MVFQQVLTAGCVPCEAGTMVLVGAVQTAPTESPVLARRT